MTREVISETEAIELIVEKYREWLELSATCYEVVSEYEEWVGGEIEPCDDESDKEPREYFIGEEEEEEDDE